MNLNLGVGMLKIKGRFSCIFEMRQKHGAGIWRHEPWATLSREDGNFVPRRRATAFIA